jgi:hypothetical protein
LDTSLAELDRILTGVQSSPDLNGLERVRLVLDVRQRIVGQIAAINNGIAGDPQLAAEPELAKEFAERLGGLRRKMAVLQAKWRSAELTDKFPLYAAESRPVAEAIAQFVVWAKRSRRAA